MPTLVRRLEISGNEEESIGTRQEVDSHFSLKVRLNRMLNPEDAYLIWISPLWKGRQIEQGVNSRAGFFPQVLRKV